MKLMPFGVASGVILCLAACPGPDRANEATAGLPEATDPGAPTITPTPEIVRVPLQPAPGSQASGEASLREIGVRTSVQLTIRDGPPNAALPAHVHRGSCQQQGPVTVPLDPVLTDAQGLGTSVTTVEMPLATLADGQHYAEAQMPGESPGPALACGDIAAAER